jgi:hypothetical protein
VFFFNFVGWGGVRLCALDTSAKNWPIVRAPGDDEYGAFGGKRIGKGNRSTRMKPATMQLYSPQISLDLIGDRTRAAAVVSRQLIT